MSEQNSNEPMLDMYLFETARNIEQLENCILSSEKKSNYSEEAINEIFRMMHTIKGSSAMMLFNNISVLAHSIEDLFYYLREQKPKAVDCSNISDHILEAVDFIKVELEKIKAGDDADGDASALIESIKTCLVQLKENNASETVAEKAPPQLKERYYITPDKTAAASVAYSHTFNAVIFFEEGCEMENIRAYSVINNLKVFSEELSFVPEDVIDDDNSIHVIRKEGFHIFLRTSKTYEEMETFFKQIVFLKDLELIQVEDNKETQLNVKAVQQKTEDLTIKMPQLKAVKDKNPNEKETPGSSSSQSIISVNVGKLDKLMDLVGEMVIAEAMVIQNPDLQHLELENFQKAARQLHKITNELQDMVMAIRMVPLAMTFQKMHRVVRDMSKKLNKNVELVLAGEETEVDKNIIEHISDPLMHLVRNAVDHGIETQQERQKKGKPSKGTVTLEAKNVGSDVLVIIKDDGKGLNREKILAKARETGLLYKPENEMTDKEIYNLIFLPGFSTKDTVSEFSGRGVGMDVVTKNIEAIGGAVSIDSTEGCGSLITLKIPLTLAIVDGMNIKVGSACYTLPITAIKESFRPKASDIVRDPDENEMIMVRGQCYPILRLHECYSVKSAITDLTQGILIRVEQEDKSLCIFADALIGQQQVVVKALPSYIKNFKRVGGLAGCTLLGDGSISLILDIGGLINKNSLL